MGTDTRMACHQLWIALKMWLSVLKCFHKTILCAVEQVIFLSCIVPSSHFFFFKDMKSLYWFSLILYRVEIFNGELTSIHKTLNVGTEQGSLLSGAVSFSNGISL